MTNDNLNVGKFSKSLQRLVELIDAGREYPDAHAQVCREFKFGVRQGETLTREYDRIP